MSEVLGMVDVVVELRDARAPVATTHPMLPLWIGSRGRVLVINRVDSVSPLAAAQWELKLHDEVEKPLVDAKRGTGVPRQRAIMREGSCVNERRKRRGINPRKLRLLHPWLSKRCKSALINRLVGQRKTV